MSEFKVFISAEEIAKKVEQIGKEISEDYQGREVTIVCILKGAFVFCADLVRHLTIPNRLEFVLVSSYEGTESTGQLNIALDLREDIEGKDVLVVEDIVDTGRTMNKLLNDFQARNPRSIKLASLFFKPSKSECPVNVDYLGFEMRDEFIIGYGLDYNGKYRSLPYVGIYSE